MRKNSFRIDQWELDKSTDAFAKISETFVATLKAIPGLHDGATRPRFNVVYDLAEDTAFIKEHTGSLNDAERLRELLVTENDPKQRFYCADSRLFILKQEGGWSCDWIFQTEASMTPQQWSGLVKDARASFQNVAEMTIENRRQVPFEQRQAYAFGLETYLIHYLGTQGVVSLPHSSATLRYPA
jgi:hypothetical protein